MSETPERNPPHAYHDETQRLEVGEIIMGLPIDHPARIAYRLGQGPLALTHLVNEELASRLKRAFLDGQARVVQRARIEAREREFGHGEPFARRRADSLPMPGGRRRTDPPASA